MSNTRQDRFETWATKAILAMQKSLKESGCTEVEAIAIIRIINRNLDLAVQNYLDGKKP